MKFWWRDNIIEFDHNQNSLRAIGYGLMRVVVIGLWCAMLDKCTIRFCNKYALS